MNHVDSTLAARHKAGSFLFSARDYALYEALIVKKGALRNTAQATIAKVEKRGLSTEKVFTWAKKGLPA